jgi:hypothetical protein
LGVVRRQDIMAAVCHSDESNDCGLGAFRPILRSFNRVF